MRLDRSFLGALLISGALAAAAIPAAAQDTTYAAPSGMVHAVGGYLVGSFPTGDWGEIAGFGIGLDGADVYRKMDKAFGVRSSFGVLYNFSRTVDIPAANVGVNDKLNLETKNWSLFFGLGPELSIPNKSATPFVFGTVGFDTYWTSSTLSGTAAGSSYSAEHGDSRISFAWSAGLGFRRRVMPGYGVELSAEYRSGSDHQYLLPKDVRVTGGAVVANRESHVSDQIIIRLGSLLSGY